MYEIAAGIVICILAVLIFEYRIKKPGQIVLFESDGKVKHRTSNLYARHFSVLMQNKTYTAVSTVEAETKKKISLNVKFSVTLSPSLEHIDKLIHIAGWAGDPISDAGNEIDVMLQGYIKEFIDTQELEDIRSKHLSEYLSKKLAEVNQQFGVEIISLTIQSIEPTDKKISEAIRQKEVTRIMEETERMNQAARINTAQVKLHADEEILKAEHELSLKKLQLKEALAGKEAALELMKLNEQMKRDKIRLAIEKEEMSILQDNPEVLLLSPQIARLAEASQNMKNAKTVVSLGDFTGSSKVVETLRDFISNIFHTVGEKKKDA